MSDTVKDQTEYINLKVKSQVNPTFYPTNPFRMGKRSFSRSRSKPSSENWWTPIAKGRE